MARKTREALLAELVQQEAEEAAKIAAEQERRRVTAEAIRQIKYDIRHARQAVVGKLADEAGLLDYADVTLQAEFALLAKRLDLVTLHDDHGEEG